MRSRENNRQAEIKELTSKGKLPHWEELKTHPEKSVEGRYFLMGKVAALIHDILPAKEIIDNMVNDAADMLTKGGSLVKQPRAKL